MHKFALSLVVLATAWAVAAQSDNLPAGIFSDSRNRLPLVKRDTLDALGQSVYDQMARNAGTSLAGFQGPGGINLYSPPVAKSESDMINYWRSQSHLGRRLYELAVLVTARELDQEFEWNAHQGAAIAAGVVPSIVAVINDRLSTGGLSPVDAVVIELGRQVHRTRRVDLATFSRARQLLGDRDLVDVVSVMGQYAATAVLLNAFEQQLPAGRVPLLR